MRLEPIEKPKSFKLRFAFFMTRRKFGKVITPLKVMLPRMPGLLKFSYEAQKFEMNGLRLEHELRHLVALIAAQINGCEFCIDIGRAVAMRKGIPMEKFNQLSEYRSSPLFSERERAALAYAEEATRRKRVSDATFEALRQHFNDREIMEITWVNALENYYNLINLPLEIESDGLCAIAETRRA